jgi:alpha/beta superfamily hydrolase
MNQKIEEKEVFIPGPQGLLEARFCELGNEAGLQGEGASFQSDGLRRGRLGIVCHPHPLYQGSMDNKVVTTTCKAWQELNISTLRFNFRGVGKSEGKYAMGEGEQEDLKAVMEWLQNQYPSFSFCLAGFSFGAYVSVSVAALNQYPLQFLLSIAPPVQHFDFSLNASTASSDSDSSNTLPNCPWSVIQGDQDEVVPFELVKSWLTSIQKRKPDIKLNVMTGASHFFHGRLPELKMIIQEETRKVF